MARRYRYEYLMRKRAKERAKALKRQEVEMLEKQDKKETKPDLKRELIGWILYIVVIVGATYFIVNFVGQRTRVSGDSMLETLHDGDNLIVDKISYRFRNPKRFEIIVFPYQHQKDTFYIKRIIGMPGETIQIQDGKIYINGEWLDEPYGRESIDVGKEGIASEPVILGEDEYFVMGDNRNHSADSRESSVGVLKKEDFVGRAWIRIWPLNSIGVLSHD